MKKYGIRTTAELRAAIKTASTKAEIEKVLNDSMLKVLRDFLDEETGYDPWFKGKSREELMPDLLQLIEELQELENTEASKVEEVLTHSQAIQKLKEVDLNAFDVICEILEKCEMSTLARIYQEEEIRRSGVRFANLFDERIRERLITTIAEELYRRALILNKEGIAGLQKCFRAFCGGEYIDGVILEIEQAWCERQYAETEAKVDEKFSPSPEEVKHNLIEKIWSTTHWETEQIKGYISLNESETEFSAKYR